MRRTIVLLMTMAMTLLLATSVALALDKTCPYSGNCYGTADPDRLSGGLGNNNIYGQSGDDHLYGSDGEDSLYGSNGNDYMYGGSDFDRLIGGSGHDRMYGGTDAWGDYYVGNGGNDLMQDQDKVKSDIYRFYFSDLPILLEGPTGTDRVADYGGPYDRLYFNSTTRNDLRITWVDTSDADVNRDALLIQDKSIPTNSVFVFRYFNNLGGTGRGAGAIEHIHFGPDIAGSDVGFPAPQG